MAKKYIGITLHGTILLYYTYTLYNFARLHEGKSVENEINPPSELKMLQKHQYSFYTCWTFIAAISFLIFAVIEEFFKILNFNEAIIKTVNRFRSYLFSVIVFPTSTTTLTVFWLIFSYNRELILPEVLDPYFPRWMNHAMHTMIVLPVIVEILLPKKYNFISYKRALRDYMIYCVIYGTLYVTIYIFDNVWLYPGFGLLTWDKKLLTVLICFVYTEVLACIGIYLQNLKRPAHIKDLKKKK